MNFLTMATGLPRMPSKTTTAEDQLSTIPKNQYLGLISWALSVGFARYQALINTQILLEEISQRSQASLTPSARPNYPPSSTQPQKPPSVSAPKVSQKNQPVKSNPSNKTQAPKTPISSPSQTATTIIPQKPLKLPSPQAVPSSKTKKKIHKFPEVKKDNAGRVPRINMVQTAEIGRARLSEREKKKIRERLLLRQVANKNVSDVNYAPCTEPTPQSPQGPDFGISFLIDFLGKF